MPIFDILSQALFGNWSLYDKSGSEAVPFDTFFSVDVVNEGKVTQYPTEPNSFASYNKVQSPGTINVTVGLTGGAMERSAVVDRLQELVASTELLSIVTPEMPSSRKWTRLVYPFSFATLVSSFFWLPML